MTRFRLATPTDDVTLRGLLRNIGMPTWVELAVSREPSFFSGSDHLGEEWAVIAEQEPVRGARAGAEVVGMYTAAMHNVHVGGRAERVGYLGGLRVVPRHRRRIRHLREGFASIPRLAPSRGTLPWWFTVISADNVPARRLLESGVRGLPTYHPLGDYVSCALATARGRAHGLWRRCEVADVDRLVDFHSRNSARVDLSPVLTGADVRRIGLESFLIHESGSQIAAVAALWDQQAFKQIIAARYRPPVSRLIPFYNCYARVARRIPLPAAGNALEQTFIAFFAMDSTAEGNTSALIEDLLFRCRTPVASIGLASTSPLTAVLNRFRPLRYPARIYALSFDSPRPNLDFPVQPEVALL
jgi:hypothetical protein